MKKFAFIFIFNIILFTLNAQQIITDNQILLLDTIADKAALFLFDRLKSNSNLSKPFDNGKIEVNILITDVGNKQKQLTKISEILSPKIANKLNGIFSTNKDVNYVFSNFNIFYSETQNINFDYVLKANYLLTNNKFVIENIKLQLKDKNYFVSIKKSFVYQSPRVKILKSIDIETDKTVLFDLINKKGEAKISQSVTLYNYKDKIIEPVETIQGNPVYNLDLNQIYKLKIDLQKEAYVYVFHYDPVNNYMTVLYPYDKKRNSATTQLSQRFGLVKDAFNNDQTYIFAIISENIIDYSMIAQEKQTIDFKGHTAIVVFLKKKNAVILARYLEQNKKTIETKKIIINQKG